MNALPALALSLLVCPVASGAPRAPRAAEEPADGAALLDRCAAALGARPAGVLRFAGTLAWEGLGIRGEFVELYGGAKRVLVTQDVTDHGRVRLAASGDRVWDENLADVVGREGWDACEALRRFGWTQRLPWRELYTGARATGEAEIEGRRALSLDLAPRWLLEGEPPAVPAAADLPADTCWLDAETLLPLRLVSRYRGRTGALVEVRTDWGDWRETAGARFPHRREVTITGYTLVLEVTGIEAGVAVDAGAFEPSAEIERAIVESVEQSATAGEVQLLELEPRHLASIRTECEHAEMERILSSLLPEAAQAALAVGAEFSGPPVVRYYTWGDELDIEVGMQVVRPVETKGRVKPSKLPGGRAAVAWHLGHYEQLGKTHQRVHAWLAENGLESGGAPWEEYWTDPGLEPDPGKWRTRIVYPLK